ncbi:MAG: arylamine N-acetyltransferase [Gaiellales bacterium]
MTREGRTDQGPFGFSLLRDGGDPDGWELVSHREGGTPGYHFTTRRADEAQLDHRCEWLQTSPESGFTQTTVAQRHLPGGHATLRGKVLTTFRAEGTTTSEVGNAAEYVETLHEIFGLDVPEAATLWPAIEARHAARFGDA